MAGAAAQPGARGLGVSLDVTRLGGRGERLPDGLLYGGHHRLLVELDPMRQQLWRWANKLFGCATTKSGAGPFGPQLVPRGGAHGLGQATSSGPGTLARGLPVHPLSIFYKALPTHICRYIHYMCYIPFILLQTYDICSASFWK